MMYKLNFLDAKRNPNALLYPLKPASDSAIQGRDRKAVAAELGMREDEVSETGPAYSYNVKWSEIDDGARKSGTSAYVSRQQGFQAARTDCLKDLLRLTRLTQNDGRILSEQQRCQSPDRSSSRASMDNNGRNLTPPESPLQLESPGAITTQDLSRLSLDHQRPLNEQGHTDSGALNGNAGGSSKRSASAELQREPNRSSPSWQRPHQQQSTQSRGSANRARRARAKHNSRASDNLHTYQPAKESANKLPEIVKSPIREPVRPLPRDSGYGSLPNSRKNTAQVQQDVATDNPPKLSSLSTVDEQSDLTATLEDDGVLLESSQRKYPGLILQPESTPISKDQLAAEVKGIYAGLVMVESKCVHGK